jgi:hypothetical protein
MRWNAVITSFALVLLVPSGALAAGGPVLPLQGGSGIAVPGSAVRIIASPAGRDTVVQRVTTRPRHIQSTLRVAGHYGIPGADYNGTLTGLSADGRALILEQLLSVYPARTTRLLVLDARRLRVQRKIVLRGWSTVDAISPDGRWLYLLHFSSANISQYEVLAYDLPRGRLITKPIVDPRDRGEAMTGLPVTRVMSPGGRWAYTLYDRPSGVPFIHALDTAGLRAVCIDLPSLSGANLGPGSLTLGPGTRTLEVKLGDIVVRTINTRTFAASSGVPVTAAQSAARPPHAVQGGGGSSLPWELVFVPIAAAAALGAGAWRRAKPRAA